MPWPWQDAKNRLGEVVRRARSDGPQTIALRGERAAIVLSATTKTR
jgi:prevent-host-death family protein